MIRQMPKIKGFRSMHSKSQTVDLALLAKAFADGALVSPKTLESKGLIRSAGKPIKILGKTELTRRFQFEGVRFSESAKAAITKAGGTIK